MIDPWKTVLRYGFTPSWLKTVSNTPKIRTPPSVLHTPPFPPARAVPPITVVAIEFRSYTPLGPTHGAPDRIWLTRNNPARTAVILQMICAPINTRSVLTPERRPTSAFPPTPYR